MRIESAIQKKGSLELTTSRGQMRLTVYNESILRIQYTLEEQFSTKPSYMVIAEPDPNARAEVAEHADHLTVSTSRLHLRIDRETGAFSYYDRQGTLLVREPLEGGKTLSEIEVVKTVFDADVELETGQGADGLRVRADAATRVVDRRAYQSKLSFEWSDGEALYGLGSHEEGMFNLRGQHQYLYQQNMKAVVPVLVSTHGYGVLMDSYAAMTFHDDAFGSYLASETDDELDYYFVYGPELDEVVRQLRSITGKAPMLPKWAYGYVQSKERYVTQQELIDVVREYRRRELPLDCIVLDWQSWTGDLWGQKTLDPARFPDPEGMMAELHRMDARLMVSIWPIMNPNSDNHKEMLAHDALLGNRATYDAFQEQARALYWKQAKEGLFSKGIDAWWCDCTEPFEADWKGAVKPGPEERMRINTDEAKRYLDPELTNAYSLLHSQGIYEGQRQTTEEKRVVNLTRSAYGGQHRYGTITWSGDICANWDTLRKQIADGLNFCATGSPYWTTDIGAFFVQNKPELWFWSGDYDDGVDDLGYRELYVRWFQYGAFLPMFRAHGTDTPREIWRFGEPGEPFYEALVRFLQLRYRLLPYIYSVAFRVHRDDYTMLRALPFDFRADAATYEVDDQFMFGPSLLVCPVTRPMLYDRRSRPLESAAMTRSVYLPQGCEWFDYWSDRVYAGGQTIEAVAPLDQMPLYVRSGSILPMKERMQHAADREGERLYIHVYTGADARFEYYEDEGDSYRYEQGSYAIVPMSWDERQQTLQIGDRQGAYPGMRQDIELTVLFYSAQDDRYARSAEQVQAIYTGGVMELRIPG